MLVLTRKVSEKLLIGDSVAVMVVDIERNRARLGIEAPRGVPIYRQELLPLDARRGAPTSDVTVTSHAVERLLAEVCRVEAAGGPPPTLADCRLLLGRFALGAPERE